MLTFYFIFISALEPKYPVPLDCEDILKDNPNAGSGVYKIYPVGLTLPISVYCEMAINDGGWTVLQKHYSNEVSFTRTNTEFINGFGDLSGNFWLGLEYMHILTDFATTKLVYDAMFVFEDRYGEKKEQIYYDFRIGDSASKYSISYDNDETNGPNVAGDGLWNGALFYPTLTTDSTFVCLTNQPNGWWFPSNSTQYYHCGGSNLNNPVGTNSYGQGMYWEPWKGKYESLKSSTIMIRRNKNVPKPQTCDDLYNPSSPYHASTSWYWIFPFGMKPIYVPCWMESGNSWTVIFHYFLVSCIF